MKARNGWLCMHAAASGVYLKAAGNQNEVSRGLLTCSDLSCGRITSVFQRELIGRRQLEIRS